MCAQARILRWLVVCTAAMLPALACAQAGRAGAVADGAARRVALVIGNNAYESSPLTNSVNDARAMAGVLQEAGFTVTLLTDIDQRQFQLALREFGEQLKASGGGGAGLFYYAGHGMQIKGRNFLIPVRSNIAHEDEVAYAAVDAQSVLDKMESAGNGTNIVILDACRNNPFARSFRSGQQGLAQMDAPVGTLVAYATAPGAVAIDTQQGLRNGLYTTHLLEAIRRPGLKVEDVLKQVRSAVLRASGNRQMPWEASALVGDFYFHPPHPPREGAAAAAVAPGPPPTFDTEGAIDDALWAALKDSRSSAEIFAYLNRFPTGRHAREARARLLDLVGPAATGPLGAAEGAGGADAFALPPSAAPPLGLEQAAAAIRETRNRLERDLVLYVARSRRPEGELVTWGDPGTDTRSATPRRNAAGFAEGDRFRYLVSDMSGAQPDRGLVWRVERIDADGSLWMNGGRQYIAPAGTYRADNVTPIDWAQGGRQQWDALGQPRSGNDAFSGAWLDFAPPLPLAQAVAAGPGREGRFDTAVQERDAGARQTRVTLAGRWTTQGDACAGPRHFPAHFACLRVDFEMAGVREHGDGTRRPVRWQHRYWINPALLMPLLVVVVESEDGQAKRHWQQRLVAVDQLGARASKP